VHQLTGRHSAPPVGTYSAPVFQRERFLEKTAIICILSSKKADGNRKREAYYGRKELNGVGYQRDNQMFEDERERP